MDDYRLNHSLAVAKKIIEIRKKYNLDDKESLFNKKPYSIFVSDLILPLYFLFIGIS